MDIKRLQQFVTLSNEDFADAHEPVNDGVKDVPDASDIAAMVGRKGGETQTDITKQGEAKVIPETEDKEEDKGTEHTESKVDEGSGPGGQDTDQPEVKTESPVEDEPELAHDDVKAVETDEKVTAKEKESLEAFAPFIRRSELIGYSKRDVEALTKSIGRVRAKAGVRGAFTVSAESINDTIALAETHLGKLARKRKFLKQRDLRVAKENFDAVVEAEVTEAPLLHPGADQLAPVVGAAITEAELAPFQDPVGEQELLQTIETIQQFRDAGVAVEQYTQLLKENKGRISKQAAAIIQTGLEHIDTTLNLRVRSTGFESFETTPRFAMEAVDVDEKTLGNRAAEIGSKILSWIKALIGKVMTQWSKFSSGLTKLEGLVDNLSDSVNKLRGDPKHDKVTLRQPSPWLFMEGEFIGNEQPKPELEALNLILQTTKEVDQKIINPTVRLLNSGLQRGTIEELAGILQNSRLAGTQIELPGGEVIKREGFRFLVETSGKQNRDFHEGWDADTLGIAQLKPLVRSLKDAVSKINSTASVDIIKSGTQKLIQSLVNVRKVQSEANESDFQVLQEVITDSIMKNFDADNYFKIMRIIATSLYSRTHYLQTMVNQYGKE